MMEIVYLESNSSTLGENITLNYFQYIQSNPKVLLAIIIQLVLGILLGYILAKAFKYIIAFVLVIIAGAILNVWSISGSNGNLFGNLTEAKEYMQYVIQFAKFLSILLVGPVLAGFIIGLIIGWLHK